jgi:APA family basic amino acid/polyamine antiporter
MPRRLTRTDAANAPIASQLLASALTVGLILLNSSKSTAELFNFVILLSTNSTLVLYVIGALAALRVDTSIAARLIIALSIPFSLFAFYGAGAKANLWGLVLLAIGFAVRWLCRRLNSSAATPLVAAQAAPPGSSA